MNCLEFRRLLFVQPRRVTSAQRAHMARCAACAEFARSIVEDDEALERALLVPVPEGLADRVLLRHGLRSPHRWRKLALAASLVIAVGTGLYFYEMSRQPDEIASAPQPGANLHALMAISYVLDREPRLLKENHTGDPKAMHAALSRLGLSLPPDLGNVRYLGTSVLPDGAAGEHIVLQTPYGHVTLMLMPEEFLASRVVVADRHLLALATPRRRGCFILIADSAQTLKRIEAMLT